MHLTFHDFYSESPSESSFAVKSAIKIECSGVKVPLAQRNIIHLGVVILPLNPFVKTCLVHSSLMTRRPSHLSSSTTTTCETRMCKCLVCLSDNSVLHGVMPFPHQTHDAGSAFVDGKCVTFSVLLVAADPNFSVCMRLIVIPGLCWGGYLFIVLHTV